jgi:probable rRNA maturation factor
MSEEPPSPSVEIAVIVEDHAWREILSEAPEIARRAARAALRHGMAMAVKGAPARARRYRGSAALGELAVVLADDHLARRLNRNYRRQNKPTNVLSFGDLDGPCETDPPGPRLLGDVVLARETIFKEAAQQNKVLGDHLCHLVVHGVLHLLGFNHDTVDRAQKMESLERAALSDLGIADPYHERHASDRPCPELGSCHD